MRGCALSTGRAGAVRDSRAALVAGEIGERRLRNVRELHATAHKSAIRPAHASNNACSDEQTKVSPINP